LTTAGFLTTINDALDDAAKAQLASMSSDLCFILGENEVPLRLQVMISSGMASAGTKGLAGLAASNQNLEHAAAPAATRTAAQGSLGFPGTVLITKLILIYFFTGPEKKGNVKHWMTALTPANTELETYEVDLLRAGPSHDLTIQAVRDTWIHTARQATFKIVTPPCSSFSRAPWANSNGPSPVKGTARPRGLPWLSTANRAKADLHNTLVDFSLDITEETTPWQVTLLGHPEDLGRARGKGPEARPASIWQGYRLQELIDKQERWCGAFL
jgi:hypothetical protein